jgi:hypothetical protein
LIERGYPGARQTLLVSLSRARTVGYDERGNRRVQVDVERTTFTVVIDEAQGVIVAVWLE